MNPGALSHIKVAAGNLSWLDLLPSSILLLQKEPDNIGYRVIGYNASLRDFLKQSPTWDLLQEYRIDYSQNFWGTALKALELKGAPLTYKALRVKHPCHNGFSDFRFGYLNAETIFVIVNDVTNRVKAEFQKKIETILQQEPEQFFTKGLKTILKLFKSRFGVFGYINEDGDLVAPSMTHEVFNLCKVKDKAIVFPRASWGGLWGKVLFEEKACFKNGPHRTPPGHLPIHTSLGVPVHFKKTLIGFLLVANKEEEYDSLDREMLEFVARLISPVLYGVLSANKLQEKLADAERLNNELKRFTHILSHDIQEPLRTIISFNGLLLKDFQDGNKDLIRKDLEITSNAANRLKETISSLLAYAETGGEFEKKVFPLNNCVENAKASLQVLIQEKKARINVSDLPSIRGNEDLLSQVFQNLISNALKFCQKSRPFLKIESELEDKFILIKVKDNGIGIPPKYLEKIFLPFQRAHKDLKYSGKGLGLSICRKIIEAHGGKIWATSKKDKGTTFYICLDLEGGTL